MTHCVLRGGGYGDGIELDCDILPPAIVVAHPIDPCGTVIVTHVVAEQALKRKRYRYEFRRVVIRDNKNVAVYGYKGEEHEQR